MNRKDIRKLFHFGFVKVFTDNDYYFLTDGEKYSLDFKKVTIKETRGLIMFYDFNIMYSPIETFKNTESLFEYLSYFFRE